ncbi:MAG: hypothetical protein ACRC8S_14930 [Fimbriiglobus sp.]
MKLHFDTIAYHRNGISGAPFHAILFCDEDEGRMLGIVFEKANHVAVIHLEKLALNNVAFGENSWRGDRYETLLREAIETHQHFEERNL